MQLGEVVGRVWPERQNAGLVGRTLVQVRCDAGMVVALDPIGAGLGTRVLLVTGSTAQRIADGAPVDAVVTAIVQSDTAAG